MNVVLISEDSREVDTLRRELTQALPAIHLDIASSVQDALPKFAACDVVVLDVSVPTADAVNLVSAIRKEKKLLGVIALMGSEEKEFPTDLLKSGVDHFVVKRPGYVASLAEMIQQAKSRYRPETPASPRRRVRLLYAGNFETAQRQLSNVPQIKLEKASITPDGLLEQPEQGAPPADALIVESSIAGANTLKVIKDANQKMPEVPVILLSDPGEEETAVQAMKAGAADCITRSGNYYHRMLLVLQKEIARRELIRERTALRSREERLRHIVESMPAGVTVIAQDGAFLAINDAGLKLIGAARLEQIVGKNVADLMPNQERQRILDFLGTVCGGTAASIRVNWKGPDGGSLNTEFRAVPMRRDAAGGTAALVVIDKEVEKPGEAAAQDEIKAAEEAVRVYEAKLWELQEKQAQQASKWEAVLKESESKRIAAEEQQSNLRNAAEEAENRHKLLAEEHRIERESWEQARQGFREQCAKIEEVAQALRSAQTNLLETHKAEQERWETLRQELEQKLRTADENRATLESALRLAESNLSEQSQQRTALLSEHSLEQTELEQKYHDAEKQQIASATALQEAESRIEQLNEKIRAELSQRDAAYQELAQKFEAAEKSNESLQSALQSEAGLQQAAETYKAELSQRDVANSDLQKKFDAAEKRTIELESSLRESESRIAQMAEKYATELFQRDSAYRDLEQKCQAAEAQTTTLQTALQDAQSSLLQMTETHSFEISRRNLDYRVLEQKCKAFETQTQALQSALQDAESRIAQLPETQKTEISRRDLAIQELEQKCRAFESQTLALQSAIHDAKSGIEQSVEIHNVELARRDAAYQELEQKLQTAEELVHTHRAAANEAKASLAQLAETQKTEISRRESAYSEMEEKLRAAESLIQALQGDQSGLAQTVEAHTAELAKRDLAQKELETKYQNAEKQRAALQNSLHDAESILSQISEKHSTELSQRDFAQKKAEQKYQTAEKQRIALEDALQDAQSSLAKISENYATERTQWDLARQELEQKCQSAEKQQATAMQNAVRETESRLAWISEQNQAKASQLEKLQQELDQIREAYGQLTAASSDFHIRNQRLSRFTSVGVVLATLDGEVLQCNDAAAKIFGYLSAEEALSQSGQNQFRIYAFEGTLAARLRQDGKLENVEWSSLGHDGRVIRVQENAALLEVPGGDAPLVERILTDISKMHKLSEEVRRARRMESTGDLAAATVKSLKDVCASLAHSGELLMKTTADSEAVQRMAEAFLADANRGVKHARQFLSVALKADRTPALLNINDILVNNDALLHSLTGADIDLQTTLAPRIGLISADHNEMVQLIGGLLASSREALPLGGTVTIETSNIEIDSLAAGFPSGLKPGIYVQIAFGADGCAVQPERRMGSNRTLAERMGGYLETTNDPKLGNVFRVYLPRVETYTGQTVPRSNTAEG
jgi:PAS domain S-box-containing protein